jgi:hypothetical protein
MHAFDHILQFHFGGPAGGLAEAAVGGEGEALGRGKLETTPDAFGYVINSFDIVAFYIHDADRDIAAFGDLGDNLKFREFAAGHFNMDFINVEIEEGGEHRFVNARTDGASFVVAEAEVSRQAAFANDRFDGAIENVHKAAWIFAMGLAVHRGFIDGDLSAAGSDQIGQFLANDWDESFGQGEPVRI